MCLPAGVKFFVFMNEVYQPIDFRPLQENDLDISYKWFLTDHVIKWYSKKAWTLSEVKAKFLPRVLGTEPTRCFLILLAEKPIGQIQMYKIDDYPKYKKMIQIDENAAGVDIFIGEEDYLHKGLGSIIIKKFLQDFVFLKLDVDTCIIGPDPKNLAAIKAYQKAGFNYFKTILNTEENAEEYLMKIKKENINKKCIKNLII